MHKQYISMFVAGAVLSLAGGVHAATSETLIEQGRDVFLNKSKGNCISCHQINDPGAKLAGHQGPPMIAMAQRFPDKRKLRAQIWDATVSNPLTIMPPLGKHWILSEDQIDAVVEYIYQF